MRRSLTCLVKAALVSTFLCLSEAYLSPVLHSSISRSNGQCSSFRCLRKPSHVGFQRLAQTSRSVLSRTSSLSAAMVAVPQKTKKKLQKGTDPEKLKLGRYELFPDNESKMNMDLDLDGFKFSGARDLRRLYHDSDEIIIAEYYMEKCPTCKMMREIMHSIVNRLEGRVQFVEIEVVKNQDVIRQAGLLSVPAVQVFKRGKIIDHFSGLQQKTKLKNRVLQLVDEHQDVY